MIELSQSAQSTAGIAILAAITVSSGGFFLIKVGTGTVPATGFQQGFFRAGHAHAGVLIIFGLLCLLLTEATTLTGGWAWLARTGVLVAAILMPAGFFFAAMGPGRQRPSRWIVLLYLGAGMLVVGLATLGVGLLTA